MRSGVGIGLLVSAAIMGCSGPKETVEAECDPGDYFDPDHVLQVDITMAEDNWDTLRNQWRSIPGELSGEDCMSEPFSGDYITFSADITIDGESQSNIGIRKKGFIGSQSATKPSLKLNIDEYEEGADLFCTDNITLNNAVQDESLIRQCLGYGVFARAGLPAPRCNFARVSMNGRDLGLYVHVEPVKRSFLRTHFGEDDGDLYEGTLSDFHPEMYRTFDPKNDDTDASLQPIVRLMEDLHAMERPLRETLEEHLNFDQFLTFWAAETWVGHWDGYAGNRNNYYVYRDTETKGFSFIPWGVDAGFEQLDDKDSIPSAGVIPNLMLRSEELSDLYYDRVGSLRGGAWDVDTLLGEVDRMEALIISELGEASEDLDDIREYIVSREDEIKDALPVSDVSEYEGIPCMRELGTLEANFDLIWSDLDLSNLTEVSEEGDLELDITSTEEGPFGFERSGAVVGSWDGDEDGEEEGALLVMAGRLEGPDEAFAIPYVYFDPAVAESTLKVTLGQTADGALLYTDAYYGFEPVEWGYLTEGSVDFDVFEPTPGGNVRGSVSTTVYAWSDE